MKPYGESLRIDEPGHIPAEHFQNKRVPREHACYTCHTTYALFGDAKAKMSGLMHLWVNYFGTIPEPIELYQPYANRECLHCHQGARSFEENEMHVDIRSELHSNELSCLDCHDSTHDLDHLEAHPMWEPEVTP